MSATEISPLARISQLPERPTPIDRDLEHSVETSSANNRARTEQGRVNHLSDHVGPRTDMPSNANINSDYPHGEHNTRSANTSRFLSNPCGMSNSTDDRSKSQERFAKDPDFTAQAFQSSTEGSLSPFLPDFEMADDRTGGQPHKLENLRNHKSKSDDRGEPHHQRDFLQTKYALSNDDSFYFGLELGYPKRSATLPLSLEPKAVSRIKYKDVDQTYGNPKRQGTFGTQNSESFEETAPWDQKAILSLDGGGIRGYSALLIIQEIMEAIKRIETSYCEGSDGPAESSYHPLSSDPQNIMGTRVPDGLSRESAKWLPCHYFDYMAGTSTGGLISIMLGRLRMNVDDCITEYKTLGGKVFGHSRWFHLRSPLWWPRDKYNHKVLEDVVKDVVKRRAPRIDTFPGGQNFSFDENRCRTVVVSFQQTKEKMGLEKPYIFRTYKNLHLDEDPERTEEKPLVRNPGEAQDIPIWQVARATSAAPTYFKPMEIDGLSYIDGGFGANNPCSEIVDEVRILNNHATNCVSTVVSIGTGKDKSSSRMKNKGPTRFINYMNVAKKWASDSEREHEVQRRFSKILGFRYYRLSVEDGLGSMKLDEWNSRGRIRTSIGKSIGRLSRGSTPVPVQDTDPTPGDIEKAVHQFDIEQQVDDMNADSLRELATSSGEEARTNSSLLSWFEPKDTLDTIREHTRSYLERDDVQRQIKEIAKVLVKGRRDRAKANPQRWERACFGAWYQCKLQRCPWGEKEYLLRDRMAHHILTKHKDAYPKDDQAKLNEALDYCKIVVL